MADAVMQLKGVTKSYGDRVVTQVLKGIDLTIARGEFAAVTGASGSGKSTLLNIMGLLDRPTSGTLLVNGQETNAMDDEQLTSFRGRTLGFIFQFHHLLPAFTARENVYMPMLLDRGTVDAQMAARADELLASVGLADKSRNLATDLSGGQQQRVAIARALALRPPVVLADEPTGNLDSETSDQVFDLLRRVNREEGTAFLVVTHDPRLADRCDRIIRLVDGVVAADASGKPGGPCRACGFGPCQRDACMLAADIPGRRLPVLP
jgi:lipoprotein-releasing system ATP-binding protein